MIKYLCRTFPNCSQSFLYKMLRKKNIKLNDGKAEGNEHLKVCDEISVYFSDETMEKFQGSAKQYDVSQFEFAFNKFKTPEIVYSDNDFMIINKPVGILSQKADPSDLSANEWLIGYCLSHQIITPESLFHFKPSVCNRLDRNTGGLLTFGITTYGTSLLNRYLSERTIRKYYHTIVEGHFNKDGIHTAYICKNNTTNKVEIRDRETSGFSKIETGIKCIKYNENSNISLLEIELITGKTHQIRAHLQHLGFPIIGDSKYGNGKFKEFIPAYENDKSKVCTDGYGKGKPIEVAGQILYCVRMEFPSEYNDGMAVSLKEPAIITDIMSNHT